MHVKSGKLLRNCTSNLYKGYNETQEQHFQGTQSLKVIHTNASVKGGWFGVVVNYVEPG